MSEALTNGVRIRVVPEYLESESSPRQNFWMHIYHVTISNEGNDVVQLVSRHWIITNGKGEVEQVRGPGVIGKQPILKPGQSFQYTSGCPLNTSMGTMHGSYQMVTEEGSCFDAVISPFTLAEPGTLN